MRTLSMKQWQIESTKDHILRMIKKSTLKISDNALDKETEETLLTDDLRKSMEKERIK